MTKSIPIDGEPEFTLLARDKSAPDMVKQWAFERERQVRTGEAPESDMAKVEGARMVATQMIAWRGSNDGAWRKPQVAKEISVNDQLMLDMLEQLRVAITTGRFYDATVRIHGIDMGLTFRDIDTGKIYELSRCVGEFAVPKDAEMAPGGLLPRQTYGAQPQQSEPEPELEVRMIELTDEQRAAIAKIISAARDGEAA